MKFLLAFAFCLLCYCSTTFVFAESELSSRISAFKNLYNVGLRSVERLRSNGTDCHCENGKCVKDSRNRWKCLCQPKYALQEDFKCKECDCGNNANCIFTKNFNPNTKIWQFNKKCVCSRGYAEKNGVCIPCLCGENSKCEFEGDEKICYCEEGFAENNGNCTACTCGEGGICEFHNGIEICSCFDGYSFNGRICQACNCGDKSKGCNFKDGTKKCNCPTGYTERNGQCEELCSTDAGCGHGGTCVPHGEGKKCVCMPGLSGDYCEHIDECSDTGKFKRCRGTNGKCTYSKEEKKAFCKCEGTMWFDSTRGICVDVCKKSVCQNGGKCIVADGVTFCECGKGLSGPHCEVVNECVKGRFVKCRGEQGTCKWSQQKKEAFCECAANQKLDLTSNICRECDCGPHSLGCGFENQQKRCKCAEGYIQEDGRCQKLHPCDPSPCKFGRCETRKRDFLCICDDPFTGRFCEISTCVNTSCYGGKCRISGQKAECMCPQGHVLENGKCIKRFCVEKKCSDGQCVVENGLEICICAEGYVLEGDACRKLKCLTRNCTGGECIVRDGNKEQCLCPPGQVAVQDKCQAASCSPETCFGGYCDIVEEHSLCICPAGYHLEGVGCFAIVCKNNPCFGGVCRVENQGLPEEKEVCSCPPGYELHGDVCELIKCTEHKCLGGLCSLVDGEEVCQCPAGLVVRGDMCRVPEEF